MRATDLVVDTKPDGGLTRHTMSFSHEALPPTAFWMSLSLATGLRSRCESCGTFSDSDFGLTPLGRISSTVSVSPDTTGDQAFDVKIASSGAVYRIPADQTVAHALQEHGVEILMSCEQGVCGTCITRVLEGECDHRDLYFTDEEKAKHDRFTPCCSRAKSGVLVLDL